MIFAAVLAASLLDDLPKKPLNRFVLGLTSSFTLRAFLSSGVELSSVMCFTACGYAWNSGGGSHGAYCRGPISSCLGLATLDLVDLTVLLDLTDAREGALSGIGGALACSFTVGRGVAARVVNRVEGRSGTDSVGGDLGRGGAGVAS